MFIKSKIIVLFAAIMLFASCSQHQKALKSADPDLKYDKAMEYYNKGQYYKAIPLLEELMGIFKGKRSTQDIYMKYCNAQFFQKNYYVAAYHYKRYSDQYSGESAEEALYKHALCFDKLSPQPRLDQSQTDEAMEAYQLFINTYPESALVNEANDRINSLRRKLEVKALSGAELYYRTKNYEAAAVAYQNILKDFPDIDEAQTVHFLSVKSLYLFADNSTISKQADRYEKAIEATGDFTYKFKSGKQYEEVVKLRQGAYLAVISSTFDNAQLSRDKKRTLLFKQVSDKTNKFHKQLDEKQLNTALALQEEALFLRIKSLFERGRDTNDLETKENLYNDAIKAYIAFNDKYASSTFAGDLLRINDEIQSDLEKIKQDGHS